MPHPYRKSDYLNFLKRISTPEGRKSNLVFALVDRKSGSVVGAVGAHNFSQVNRSVEIGYWLAKSHWGKGYVVEAVTTVVEYLFLKRKLIRIYAKVFHPNVRSARVLEKAGFRLEGRLRRAAFRNNRWVDELLFGLLREEWRDKKKTRRRGSTGSKSQKIK